MARSIEQRAHNQKLETEIHETLFQCSCTHSKVIYILDMEGAERGPSWKCVQYGASIV